jgi:CubicO group peptidase (beta-lactamase class C family)
MLTLLPASLAVSLAAAGPAQIESPRYSEQLQAIEAELVEEQRRRHIPGMALCIVKDDEVIYMKGFGLRDVEAKLPVTPQTLFRLGSVTKAFTAAVTVIAAEQGKLSLDDHPARYAPELRLSDWEANRRLKIEHLLAHSAGLASHAGDVAQLLADLSPEDLLRTVSRAKVVAMPGERISYSNAMYIGLGQILASVHGKAYDQVLRDELLQPLGMEASGVSLTAFTASPDRAKGYLARETPVETAPHDFRELWAGGGLHSSIEDMSRFVRFMLGRGKLGTQRLMSESAWRNMTTIRLEWEPGGGPAFGWMRIHDQLMISGDTPGFNAKVGLLPDLGLGFVLLTNVTSSGLERRSEEIIWKHLAGKILPSPAAREPEGPSPKFDPPLAVEELAKKVEAAHGPRGPMALTFALDHETEGVSGLGSFSADRDGAWISRLELFAAGKRIAERDDSSSDERSPYLHILRTRTRLTRADFAWASLLDSHGMNLPWKGAEIVGRTTVEGQDVYIVVKKSAIGPVREYYSTETHLLLRRDDVAGGVQTFTDYRSVNGVLVPFRRLSSSPNGGRSVLSVRTAGP